MDDFKEFGSFNLIDHWSYVEEIYWVFRIKVLVC